MPAAPSKAPSEAVLMQVIESDRAAFVQRFAQLVPLLYCFSES